MKGAFEKNKTVPKVGQEVWFVIFGDIYRDRVINVFNSDLYSTGSVNTTNGKHVSLSVLYDHEPKCVTGTDEYGTFQDWE